MKTTKLLNGKVESAIVEPEPTKKVVVRLMKVISITRTPEGRVAHIQLSMPKMDVGIHIDEGTARAIAKVFDDA